MPQDWRRVRVRVRVIWFWDGRFTFCMLLLPIFSTVTVPPVIAARAAWKELEWGLGTRGAFATSMIHDTWYMLKGAMRSYPSGTMPRQRRPPRGRQQDSCTCQWESGLSRQYDVTFLHIVPSSLAWMETVMKSGEGWRKGEGLARVSVLVFPTTKVLLCLFTLIPNLDMMLIVISMYLRNFRNYQHFGELIRMYKQFLAFVTLTLALNTVSKQRHPEPSWAWLPPWHI